MSIIIIIKVTWIDDHEGVSYVSTVYSNGPWSQWTPATSFSGMTQPSQPTATQTQTAIGAGNQQQQTGHCPKVAYNFLSSAPGRATVDQCRSVGPVIDPAGVAAKCHFHGQFSLIIRYPFTTVAHKRSCTFCQVAS